MGLLANPTCLRCPKMEASLIHCIWLCPIINPFWLEVYGYCRSLTKQTFQPNIESLFSILRGTQQVSKANKALAERLAVATRKA